MVSKILEIVQRIESHVIGKKSTPKWMNIDEAAKFCAVSPSTLRRNVKSGKLKASRTTGRLLFEEANLIQWLR